MAKPVTHSFTSQIIETLKRHFSADAETVFENSQLLEYLNLKTKSANKGSKSRGSFGNHYALYVIIEDYIKNGFFDNPQLDYSKYDGAKFTALMKRQRELPFGSKLQNHPLNGRCNDEFRKYFPLTDKNPIVRDNTTQKYWIQDDFLLIPVRSQDGTDKVYNIAKAIIEIIEAYVVTKKEAFEGFIDTCKKIAELGKKNPEEAKDFVISQLQPNVDARVFEIISYAVLKEKYGAEEIWIGNTQQTVIPEPLILYKTGRTNANDGGIDFVMKPLGRFFQVTETIDVAKYFLDIDKVQRFPITFVVKSNLRPEVIRSSIEAQAKSKYKIDAVVASYMDAVEEIINVEFLISSFEKLVNDGKLENIMSEIIKQSKVEFNYSEAPDEEMVDEEEEAELEVQMQINNVE